ncbi:hypothetical protein MTP99_001615 [Tenebrio molitor]|jgi:hypothetical protein|nr:hypothetical protein MTP99_001615 [Tenebrio molitor]CAH1365337.1 unnamed protein product [Tenebrio molitor]
MERPGEYGDDPPPGLEAMWGMEAAAECDCPGPPPEFLLPPPPRPPILQPSDPMYCTEDPLPIETCDALPLIDASYRSSPSLQTSAVIVLCSVLGLFVFIAIILVWKHKRKVQNFLPCKTSPQNNCDGPTAAGGIYEDLHDVIPRPTPTHHHPAGGHIVAPSIEMIDVKNNIHYPSGYPISQHPPVFLCSSPGPDPYCSQDLYNPVYEELSDADSELAPAPHSEDEFAEDELSLGGEMDRRRLDVPPPPYRPEPPPRGENARFRRPHEPLPPIPGNKRHRSLDRRRQEFHEGMLLDALLQLYPRVGSVEPPHRRQIPSITQRIQCLSQTPGPYETVPVLGHLATFRPVPKPYSQDSAFGSDSGYSNHTSGTRGSSRGRRDPRRLSQLSADLTLT